MKSIRFNTFETNSSSTHSLIVLSKEQAGLLDTELFIYDDSVNTFKCLVNGEISLSWNDSNIINL